MMDLMLRRLSEADLQAAASQLDLPLATLKAVQQVESRGSGFLKDGRPCILLERHVAWQRIKLTGLDVDAIARDYPAICQPRRGGYAGNSAEWVRFASLASVSSPGIAIESCSWGLFQIMGYHWSGLGYASAEDWHASMQESEAAQLQAFVRFLQQDPALCKALKARKWADFAKRYNGPAYADNRYDTRLATACAMAERLTA